ncbi:MAG TPA: Chromate resistance protein ChrB [Pirellulales bacterium]
MNKWLLLVYKIPREPSLHRVSIWRKLKQLGAILLHDAVWVLPETPQTREHFQWLAAEIVEFGGEATVFVSELDGQRQQTVLAKEFSARVDDVYHELLVQLKRKNPDLAALARRYQQTLAQDYFRSKLGDDVRRILLAKGEKTK